ncbi:hypothetical protein [Nocardia sp. NPDC057440]|uniref:hypothetical protein n=1 Tax=Nocardia sp. NPDC057440 TaxID=3346134 RepID=UPI00366C78D9
MARIGRSRPASNYRPNRPSFVGAKPVPASDTVALVDTAAVVATVPGSESVAVADLAVLVVAGSDSIAFADTAGVGPNATETASFTESAMVIIRATESIDLADTAFVINTVSVSEDIGVVDDALVRFAVSDTIGLADDAAFSTSTLKTASDDISYSETALQISLVSVTESVAFAESAKVIVQASEVVLFYDSEFAFGDGLVLQGDRIVRVDPERRVYRVLAEDRVMRVDAESRVYKVGADG